MTATSIVDPEQVAATLEAAADYIDEHGWCQDNYWNAAGQVCVFGALRSCSHMKLARFAACRALNIVIGGKDFLDDATTSRWNDLPGREQWEVTDLLRSTAKKVRHGDIELS